MIHCCSVCGFSLFWCGDRSQEIGICGSCRRHRRDYGKDPNDAARQLAVRTQESVKADQIKRKTMIFRDDRRGADGVPNYDDWSY